MSPSSISGVRDKSIHSDQRPASLSDLIKFTAVAAVLAIFADASVAHAILWENDPYWTYWVTDTLLMATVFGLGTALLGIGRLQGAIITLVHIVLLTVYYWSLSPIGLPSSPEWLDFKHTWLTGLPVHLGVYYLGYLAAVWLWRRRAPAAASGPQADLARTCLSAVVVAAAIVVLLGLTQTVVTGEFPGLTWFVMRLAVTVPFLLGWWRLAGDDDGAAIAGGVALALLLATYGHYLGPVGLPNEPARLLAEHSPGAESYWLSYRSAFLVILPLSFVLTTGALLLASRFLRRRRATLPGEPRSGRALVWPALLALGTLGIVGAIVFPLTGPDDSRATIRSAGAAQVGHGPAASGLWQATAASLGAVVEDRNMIRTPLPPHDRVDIVATIRGADGRLYQLQANRPMVAEPGGRFPTWGGVGFDVWRHGRSGIGLGAAPATNSEIGVFALGDLSVDGSPIATGVPVQLMTSPRDGARLELLVGDPAHPAPGVSEGHLRVVWSDYVGGHPDRGSYARHAYGGAMLLILLGFAFVGARARRRGGPDVSPSPRVDLG